MNTNIEMTDDTTKILMQLKEPEGLIIQDNSMFPVICEGSKITPEILPITEYRNGDILAINMKGTKKIICRKCLFTDESRSKITLFAFDQQIADETFSIDDIVILGKVKRIITELE